MLEYRYASLSTHRFAVIVRESEFRPSYNKYYLFSRLLAALEIMVVRMCDLSFIGCAPAHLSTSIMCLIAFKIAANCWGRRGGYLHNRLLSHLPNAKPRLHQHIPAGNTNLSSRHRRGRASGLDYWPTPISWLLEVTTSS
jgi:hypothetical protein